MEGVKKPRGRRKKQVEDAQIIEETKVETVEQAIEEVKKEKGIEESNNVSLELPQTLDALYGDADFQIELTKSIQFILDLVAQKTLSIKEMKGCGMRTIYKKYLILPIDECKQVLQREFELILQKESTLPLSEREAVRVIMVNAIDHFKKIFNKKLNVESK